MEHAGNDPLELQLAPDDPPVTRTLDDVREQVDAGTLSPDTPARRGADEPWVPLYALVPAKTIGAPAPAAASHWQDGSSRASLDGDLESPKRPSKWGRRVVRQSRLALLAGYAAVLELPVVAFSALCLAALLRGGRPPLDTAQLRTVAHAALVLGTLLVLLGVAAHRATEPEGIRGRWRAWIAIAIGTATAALGAAARLLG